MSDGKGKGKDPKDDIIDLNKEIGLKPWYTWWKVVIFIGVLFLLLAFVGVVLIVKVKLAAKDSPPAGAFIADGEGEISDLMRVANIEETLAKRVIAIEKELAALKAKIPPCSPLYAQLLQSDAYNTVLLSTDESYGELTSTMEDLEGAKAIADEVGPAPIDESRKVLSSGRMENVGEYSTLIAVEVKGKCTPTTEKKHETFEFEFDGSWSHLLALLAHDFYASNSIEELFANAPLFYSRKEEETSEMQSVVHEAWASLLRNEAQMNTLFFWALNQHGQKLVADQLDESNLAFAKEWITKIHDATSHDLEPNGVVEEAIQKIWTDTGGAEGGDRHLLAIRFWIIQLGRIVGMDEVKQWGFDLHQIIVTADPTGQDPVLAWYRSQLVAYTMGPDLAQKL